MCRDVYEYMLKRQKEKGRLRGGKGETFSVQQIQLARDEYDEEATLFVFRLKSLKQGQSRSLLTQAARHHAAQVCFLFLPFFFVFFFCPHFYQRVLILYLCLSSYASSRRHLVLLKQQNPMLNW